MLSSKGEEGSPWLVVPRHISTSTGRVCEKSVVGVIHLTADPNPLASASGLQGHGRKFDTVDGFLGRVRPGARFLKGSVY